MYSNSTSCSGDPSQDIFNLEQAFLSIEHSLDEKKNAWPESAKDELEEA